MAQEDYLLGVNDRELERLRFQHEVWGPLTRDFLRRIGVGPGWRCLDAGAGPGFVSGDLRKMIGDTGALTALDRSATYLAYFKGEAEKNGWHNVTLREGSVEEAHLPREEFDLVFLRWVISFAENLDRFLAPLVAALRPGGVIALQDYYYEGLSLFPRGSAFDEAPELVVRYYGSEGGDPYVTGRIPALFRRMGIRLTEFSPHCLAGGPGSGVMEWGHRFFSMHLPLMAERGLVSRERAAQMVAAWEAHRRDPDALFFSPLVVDIAGVRLETPSGTP